MLTSKRGQSVKEFNAGLWHLFNNGLLPQYLSSSDDDGNVTSYTKITTNTDDNGNSYIFTNYYDANWKLIESTYSDSSGNNSLTQYQTSTDDDGNVTSYTYTTTNTDANGNSHSSSSHYDSNWNLTESAYSDRSGDNSTTQYQTSTDADGKVTVTVPATAGAESVTAPLVSPDTITLDILNPLYHNTTQREPLETVTTAPLDTVIGPADEPEYPAAIV